MLKGPGKNPEKETTITETRTLWHELYDWLDCIAITFICVFVALTFLFRVVTIDGDSMLDTLVEGDSVLISNLAYTPKQGDIVVISRNYSNNIGMNNDKNSPIIKRVIAVAGQWVNIDFDEGRVYVGDSKENLEPLEEYYVKTPTNVRGDFTGPIQIEEGHIFVLGDNRNLSLDSRYEEIGQVDTRFILGKGYFRIMPLEKFGDIY